MRLFELFIGFRYLKAKKSQGFISSNTFLSIFIVFLGVFILIVVLSVMSGFQAAIKDKILDVDSHINITNGFGSSSALGIKNYDNLVNKVKSVKDVRSVLPYIQSQGLFRFKNNIAPVMIRGMGNKGNMPTEVKKFIINGHQDYDGRNGIFIGHEMSLNYNIKIGEEIELIVPKGRLTVETGITPGLERFKVIGFFKTGYYEFDTKLIIMSLPSAQKLFEIGNTVSGIGLKINDVLYNMDRLAKTIQSIVGYDYITMTAEERNQNLFYALKLEKLIMFIILSLVIISAGFTIMGTLVMVVMEKKKAVGVLKSMGASPNSIMVIFILEGFLIGITGTIAGVILGIATSLNLQAIILWIEEFINGVMMKFYLLYNSFFSFISNFIPIDYETKIFYKISIVPTQVYYIEGIPTEVRPELVVLIAVLAVFLCTVAAIFPAWNASRLRPVETIRYE